MSECYPSRSMARDPFRKRERWGDVDEDSAVPEQGFGPCIWNVEQKRELKSGPADGSKTVLEILTKSKEPMVGNGGGYQWLTLNQYYDRVTNLAKGEEGAAHGFNETQAHVAVVDSKLLKVLLKILPQRPGRALGLVVVEGQRLDFGETSLG
eukprot:Skav217978  [mRNA]  locus=scaffold496:172086:181203:- [translate_table: standard]